MLDGLALRGLSRNVKIGKAVAAARTASLTEFFFVYYYYHYYLGMRA